METCIRCSEPISGDPRAQQLIRVKTDEGQKLAHDCCVPSCPKCQNQIFPHQQAQSSSNDALGRPVIEHIKCPS